MNVVDRLTRGRVSQFAWGALLVACALMLVVAIGAEGTAIRVLEIVLGFGVLVLSGLTALSFRVSDPTVDRAAVGRLPRGESGGDDAAQLRQELAEARSQLRQAEEAFRFREAQRSKSGEPALRAEVAELREALAAAEASADRARAEAAGLKAAETKRLEELEDRLLEEQLRRVKVERAAQDATSAAEIAERERSKELEEARGELEASRAQLQAALFEARAAKRRTAKRTTAKATGTKTRRGRSASSTAAPKAEVPPEPPRAEAEDPPEPPRAEAEVTESEEGAPDDPAA